MTPAAAFRSFLFVTALVAFAGIAPSFAEDVTIAPEPKKSLNERWKWAVRAATEKHYWIGYSIPRLMERNSFVGSFNSDMRRNRPSLCEQLGLTGCDTLTEDDDEFFSGGSNDGITMLKHGINPHEKVLKQVACLFEVTGGSELTVEEIKTSNLCLRVDLHHEHVYWLGETDDSSSVRLLESLYKTAGSERARKEAVTAVGLHSPSGLNVGFLKDVLNSDESREIRKDAAFWLGQSGTDEAMKALLFTAENDESESVCDGAVFGLSQMNLPAADDALIRLATKSPVNETRKKALFWLGQKASKKATATLESVANDDADTDVQKSAIFALTQLPDGQGIDPLIKIAKTHKNPRVRKDAIFWLGQSDNEKALQTIIDIIKN